MKIKKNGIVVNLTESDLRKIVRRTLRESSDMMLDDMEMDFSDNYMGNKNERRISKDEMVNIIADFFKDEVLSNGMGSISEEEEDLGSRGSKFAEKAMMRGGLGTSLAGLTGLVGSAMGWSDLEFTTRLHEYVDSLGLGIYAGPISMGMIVAGLALAVAGRNKQYKRTGK